MMNRERQEVRIAHLARPDEILPLQKALGEQARACHPELMEHSLSGLRQPCRHVCRFQNIGIMLSRQNPDAAVLGEGTGGPP
jgi:hypothetical protein